MCRDQEQETSDPVCQIVELMPILDMILRRHWISYRNHLGRHQQMEDHFQNLLLSLIEDDYRRLRSHDQRSSLHAWLRTVTKHYLANCIRCQTPAEGGSEVLPDALRREASQEEEMIYRERLERVQEVFGQLSDQERLLCELLRSDWETEEIAVALKIEPHQVRKRKYNLIKKIRMRLAEGDATPGKNKYRNAEDIFLKNPSIGMRKQ
jgi:RNA polymerase sigma factor (sigma-70 family)